MTPTWNTYSTPTNERGGLRRIADLPRPCIALNHNPPSHIVLSPGVYEYTCPSCGAVQRFVVPHITA